MIILYTKNICPKCLWVKSELQNAGLAYEEKNLDKDEYLSESFKAQGILTAPVFEFNDSKILDVKEMIDKINEIAEVQMETLPTA